MEKRAIGYRPDGAVYARLLDFCAKQGRKAGRPFALAKGVDLLVRRGLSLNATKRKERTNHV